MSSGARIHRARQEEADAIQAARELITTTHDKTEGGPTTWEKWTGVSRQSINKWIKATKGKV